MRRKYGYLFFLILTLIFSCSTKKEKQLSQRQIKIIAHRGFHKEFPENTLSAIHAAIEKKLDFVEVDVRTTADGHLIVMHDQTIDRTTDGTGKVSELTLEQVQRGNVIGRRTQFEKVPLFSEALNVMSDKIGVYVDVKDADSKIVLAELEKFDMLKQAVIYANDTQLAEFKRLNRDVKIMPEVDSEEDLKRVLISLQPPIVAMSWHGFSEELVEKIHQAGIPVFLDILGAGDNPAGVKQVIAAGVDGIQTDDPEMVLKVFNVVISQQ